MKYYYQNPEYKNFTDLPLPTLQIKFGSKISIWLIKQLKSSIHIIDLLNRIPNRLFTNVININRAKWHLHCDITEITFKKIGIYGLGYILFRHSYFNYLYMLRIQYIAVNVNRIQCSCNYLLFFWIFFMIQNRDVLTYIWLLFIHLFRPRQC